MPSKDNYYSSVKAPSFLKKLIPGSKRKYQQAQKEAEEKFQSHMKNYEMAEAKRKSELIKLREEYEREKQLKIEQRNKEVDEFGIPMNLAT
jgi:mannose/fructose/N-acetylgalactosamine-specific phosphotransferase system component IID